MKLNNEAVNSRRDPNNPAASANYTVYSQEKIENTIAGTNPYYYPAVDWYDELFNDYALSTRVNANLSGGGSAVRYYVAASYTKDGGVIKMISLTITTVTSTGNVILSGQISIWT